VRRRGSFGERRFAANLDLRTRAEIEDQGGAALGVAEDFRETRE
jgi:hypothetical protein